ncbi:MAG TPA: DEAD/DEAH box helicase family protein [Gemmataceae bacterium]|nr:DEAD/DEAH box helicase family protein [Gemmataceae bacterium]
MTKRPAHFQPAFDFSNPAPSQPETHPLPKPKPKVQLSLFDFDYSTEQASPIEQATHQPDPSSSPINLTPQPDRPPRAHILPEISKGDKAKARDIIAAIRTLQAVEGDDRPATDDERRVLSRFPGFGAVAMSIFPDPVTSKYRPGWQEIGDELKALLTPEEYDSAKRTTFNAFYTSPIVMQAIYDGIKRIGVPDHSTVLEPGCGVSRFMAYAPDDMRFIGVELDSLSARIAKLLHPHQDIRCENFRDSKLPPVDAAIGNVPFADIHLDHNGHRFSLHDYCIAKSVDSLKPGGVLAVVTSHFTLDKVNADIREYLGERADFLGAIRLPADAFKNEGTAVVTDILFMQKRAPGDHARHVESEWCNSTPFEIDGAEVPVNRYFQRHPEMVLGDFTRKNTMYGDEGHSVRSNGDLAAQLAAAVEQLPKDGYVWPGGPRRTMLRPARPAPDSARPAPDSCAPVVPPNLSEGSFFVADGRIHQMVDGQGVPVVYGGSELWAQGAMFGRRIGALIGLRDRAREVLRTQNEGRPEAERSEARRELNYTYDRFTSQFGPINKTTFSETQTGTIRRMPNIAKFREDPDAMLVLSLEDYSEDTGTATKAAIFSRDVVGIKPAVTHVASAEEGLLVSLNQRGTVDLTFISGLYGKPEGKVIEELGDLIYLDPESKQWQTVDEYLSGNVRAKLAAAERLGAERNAEALRKVQPEDVLPGDIDANLGAPWLPESDIHQFAIELFRVEADDIAIGHLKQDATWSVEPSWAAKNSVPATTEFGTARANGTWLLELALNMKQPTIYDTLEDDKKVVNQEQTLAAREKQKQIKERFKAWVFADPDRTERLVRLYNDKFNNLRPRLFDGSHLDFPGMNQTITLNPHQTAAVWRAMSAGNTLLAHAVGAGKSYEMSAACMKMRQAGITRKCLVAVPNHLLEQFGREFLQLYPNAKILIASKEDFTRERRKHLTAKIATGDWDAIIVTHSSFEKIGMSRDYQEDFLREQIAEYEHLLVDCVADKSNRANRNLLKTIEKQKAAREEKLTELMAEDKKDDGLTFDSLGVDQLFIDECFPYDTLVETDRGPLRIGDIVSQHLNVRLRTWNRISDVLEWKPIVNWFANKRRTPLVLVHHEHGSFICTTRHKLWIAGIGYKEACNVKDNESLLILRSGVHHRVQSSERVPQMPARQANAHEALRMVPRGVYLPGDGARARPQATPQILYKSLQGVSAACQSKNRGQIQSIHASPLGQLAMQGASESWSFGMDESEPICLSTRNCAKNITGTITQKKPPCSSLLWWQRQTTSTAAIASRGSDGNAHGVCNQDTANQRPDGETTSLLQSRPGRSCTQTRNRSGRVHPLVSQSEDTRRQEGQGPLPSRVVSVTILEPGSDGEYRFGGRTHQIVYDIEVADNHNYFANGALVSNCQAFKNLETPTKMDRVAGIQTGGSERAFDMYMKARYLHEKHPGHGVVFASGTPISNSLVEMYTLQRFLDPDGLRDRGIDHFDAWAATFGEVVEQMEISPDGKTLKPRARFSKFVNLPELQSMFRHFADVQTAEMLNLPRPGLEGGKPQIVSRPMSADQHAQQQELVERYERIRNGGVDPREDNALKITTEGRKLALDARMLDAGAEVYTDGKIEAMIENIHEIWQRTADKRGTQIVFCDMGVNPTPWGYSVYDEIAAKLTDRGVPHEQIAVIGDADTDAKKFALFEKVRQGTVRVLIGSTSKLGTGTNVQKRLCALHHLDAPWKPAEVEQRDGRILRQGNEWPEVAIYRYVTEGSFDAYMWQTLETKARFIAQIMTGKNIGRQAEDIGGQELSYAEVKAIASGNPAVLTLAEADAELHRLGVLKRSHADEQYIARKKLKELPGWIEQLKERLAGLTADGATLKAHADDGITIGGHRVMRDDLIGVLNAAIDDLPTSVNSGRRYPLGTYRGLRFGMVLHPHFNPEAYLEGETIRTDSLNRDHHGARAVLNGLERISKDYHLSIERTLRDLALAEGQLRDFTDRHGLAFAHETYLGELTALRDALKVGLSENPPEGTPPVAETADRIKALKASNVVDTPAGARAERTVTAEEPVTRRIQRQRDEQPEPTATVDEMTNGKTAAARGPNG